jgi:hypothetical protein
MRDSFGHDVSFQLTGRAFAGLPPPALEGFFIASPAFRVGHRILSRAHRPSAEWPSGSDTAARATFLGVGRPWSGQQARRCQACADHARQGRWYGQGRCWKGAPWTSRMVRASTRRSGPATWAMDDGLPMSKKFNDSSPQNALVNLRLPTSEPFQPLHPPSHSYRSGPKANSDSPTSEI